jgi:hypothetical protein
MWRVVIYQGFMENSEQQLVIFFFKLVTLIDLLLPCSVKQDNTCLTEILEMYRISYILNNINNLFYE